VAPEFVLFIPVLMFVGMLVMCMKLVSDNDGRQ
jgi:hypothetical protein